jgi:hypothetical protein
VATTGSKMGYRNFVHIQVACAIVVIAAVGMFGLMVGSATIASPLSLVLKLSWIYALPLAVSIMSVMFERAGSPDAILGHRAQANGPSLRQAILQNTLEQTILGFLSLLAFGSSAPPRCAALLIVAAALFVVGRLCFAIGYAVSPMYRFFGFALNFYASCALLGSAVWFQWIA